MTEPRASFQTDEFNWCLELAERLRQGPMDDADRADLIEHLDQFVIARRCDLMDAALYLNQRLLEASTEPGTMPAWRQLGVLVTQRRVRELLRS